MQFSHISTDTPALVGVLVTLLVQICAAALGTVLIAWGLRKALRQYEPENHLNTWPRAFAVAGVQALLGLVLELGFEGDAPFWLQLARFGVFIGMLVPTYRIGLGFALGLSVVVQLVVGVAVAGVSLVLVAAVAVHPLLAVLVAVLGVAGVALHQLSAWRLQARFDAVE